MVQKHYMDSKYKLKFYANLILLDSGLVYYEEHLDIDDEEKTWIESKRKNVNLVTQAEFDKLKPESGKKISNPAVPPPPPPLNTPANGAFLHSGNLNFRAKV